MGEGDPDGRHQGRVIRSDHKCRYAIFATSRQVCVMTTLPRIADIGCLLDYLIVDLLETKRWTTTPVYGRGIYRSI